MTLIIGIKCKDAIVMAADGAVTYDAMGQHTIRQHFRKKLRIIGGQIVIGTSGFVGLGQRFAGEIDRMVKAGKFKRANKDPMDSDEVMVALRDAFWQHIGRETEIARCLAQSIGPPAIHRSLTNTLVGMPAQKKLSLFHLDEQAAPEEATDDVPFYAVGRGVV